MSSNGKFWHHICKHLDGLNAALRKLVLTALLLSAIVCVGVITYKLLTGTSNPINWIHALGLISTSGSAGLLVGKSKRIKDWLKRRGVQTARSCLGGASAGETSRASDRF
jgi:hypothetical protein